MLLCTFQLLQLLDEVIDFDERLVALYPSEIFGLVLAQCAFQSRVVTSHV